MPTLFTQLKTARDHEPEPPGSPVTSVSSKRSSISKMGVNRTSQVRVEVRREFLKTTNKGTQDEAYSNPESLPSLEVAFDTFQRIYPKFAETLGMDDLRDREYYHLEESQHVCMDYCGFGLFSYYQQVLNKASSSFGLAYISANLPTHALYGAADEGTVEYCIRKRVMDYLNINETEYSMVFTASRGSAFKLLAESYPFHLNQKLLTVYDFESEAVNWMAECAKQKGAKIMSACFKWPSLRIGTSDLKKQLQEKKRKGEQAKGLFVFPVQSRMTGAKYSYQWMSQAQQNKWHVLLDASALGPKDMDSLGLSLFRPDFIVSSFYKIFGTDPTGFGCLFIKNTAIQSLHNSSRARAVGMVRIVPSNSPAVYGTGVKDLEEDDGEGSLPNYGNNRLKQPMQSTSSFSGPYFKAPDVDLGIVDLPNGRKQKRVAKSWRRNGRIASDVEQSYTSTAARASLRGKANEIEEGPDDTEYVAQLTKSRYYSEKRASEIEEDVIGGTELGHSEPLSRSRNGWRANESGDDRASEVGISGQLECSELTWLDSVNEIAEDVLVCSTLQSQFIVDRDVLNIVEDRAEGQEIVEVCESSMANRNWSSYLPVLEERRYGEAVATEAASGDLGGTHTEVISSIEVDEPMETIGWGVSSNEGLRRRASFDRITPETGPTDLFPLGQHHSLEHLSVEDARESSENSIIVWESNEVLEQTEEGEGAHGLEGNTTRLKSFEGTASFRRLTGKELSDFQEMGVLGLVQKFQSLHGGSDDFDKELMEGIIEAKADPLHEWEGSIENVVFTSGTVGSRSPPHNVELRADPEVTNLGEYAVKTNVEYRDHSRDFPACDNLHDGSRGREGKDIFVFEGFDTSNLNLTTDLIDEAEKKVNGHDDDSGILNRGERAGAETMTRDMNESLALAACPAGEILPTGTVVDAMYNEDDYVALQQRLAAVRDRERERALHGLSRKELQASPASIVGGDEDWSQDEEFPQEHLKPSFPRRSEDGEIATSSGRVESLVEDHETGAAYLSEGEVLLAQAVNMPSPARSASFAFSQVDSNAIAYHRRDDDCDERDSNDLVLWEEQETARLSIGARSAPDTASILREDECERSLRLTSDRLPIPVNAVHNLQTSITFRLDGGGTPYESGEENYITILPSSSGKNWADSISETMNEEGRSFGSRVVSDDENSCVITRHEGEKGLPAADFLSCTEKNFEGEDEVDFLTAEEKNQGVNHVSSLERSFKISLASPRIESDTTVASLQTPLQVIASPYSTTSSINHGRGRSLEDTSFDTADFHDATEMAWRNGRSDLRSNRTLSRDVDFDDDTFSARASSASERFLSRKPTTLAEDIAQIDLQGSDEDSFFQSRYYDESLQGSSTSRYFADEVPSSSYPEGDSEEELDDIPGAELWKGRSEPILLCRGLDLADSLGLTKVNYRLRYLINWLVNSLLKLRHPGPNRGIDLVRIYGPKVKYDRGASVAFNMFDWKGGLIQPGLVQRLADRSNISLGVGRLCNIVDPDLSPDFMGEKERLLGVDRGEKVEFSPHSATCSVSGKCESLRIPVVTASMGFVTNFEDVFKLWSFLAKFLDADFVSKEVWRYHSLNQQTIVM